jgi:hypothetical protein
MAGPQATRTTTGDGAPASSSGRSYKMQSEGGGWLTFAGVMLLLAATFNAIYGIAALANDDYFAADELLFGDLSLWGALYLIAACSQALAGFLVLARSPFGAFLGIVLAMLSATVALFSMAAYPIWSIIVMVVDGMIIYGLTVYGFNED